MQGPVSDAGMVVDSRIAFFDAKAAAWEKPGTTNAELYARLEGVAGCLGLEAGQNVLEVGCGTGAATMWLAERVRPGQVVSVDFSPRMIELARHRRPEGHFLVWDACSEPLDGLRFEVIFCLHVFPHLRDVGRALANFAAMSTSQGRLIVLHLSSREQVNAHHRACGGVVAQDLLPEPERWPRMLEPAGWRISRMIDREDLFLVMARKSGDRRGQAPHRSP